MQSLSKHTCWKGHIDINFYTDNVYFLQIYYICLGQYIKPIEIISDNEELNRSISI